MKVNPTLLALLRGKKAADGNIRWKDLAKECGISRPYLSQMVHGDIDMRPDVLEILLDRLNLGEAVRLIGLIPE